MRVQKSDTPASVIAFGPKKGPPDATMVADDAGQHIVALVQKASDMAKADYQRAMDLAQRISSDLRAAEERGRELGRGELFSRTCRSCGRMAHPH